MLGLPTGRTPVGCTTSWAGCTRSGEADFSQATTFNLDEFLGIPARPSGQLPRVHAGAPVRAREPRPERIHFLNGAAPDPTRKCARYERAIAAAGGIDLQILGIGTNGHIGFNEPARELAARTHRVTLKP